MYKVVNAERTAKVDAPSMADAAAQFLNLPIKRILGRYISEVRFSSEVEHPKTMRSAMYSVLAEGLRETDEHVAVFEIENESTS